jgi:hypothetical protein
VPDVAPDDGVQPSVPQFIPPHVRLGVVVEVVVGSGVVEVVVGSGVVEIVEDTGEVVFGTTAPMLHVPVKPLYVIESSDVKITWRKPVVDVLTLPVLTDPDCFRISDRVSGEHEAELHS